MCGLSNEKINEAPFKGWRKYLTRSLIYFGKALRFCCSFHKVKINGKRASRDEATILVVAPHTSLFDFFIGVEAELPCVVSRSENATVPLVGNILKAIQPILVTR